jgi:hypothetical protein
MNFICKIQVLFTASNSGRFLWGFGHNTPPKLPNARPNFHLQGQNRTIPIGAFQTSRLYFAGLARPFPVSTTQIGIAHEIRLDVNLILFHPDFKNL